MGFTLRLPDPWKAGRLFCLTVRLIVAMDRTRPERHLCCKGRRVCYGGVKGNVPVVHGFESAVIASD
jgi:hypothetical protein